MKNFIFFLSFCFGIITSSNAQCILNCYSSVNVSLDASGSAVVTSDMLVAGIPPSCNVELALFETVGGVQILPYGESLTIDCSLIGTYVYEVKEVGGGNLCWGHLVIEDVSNNCPLNIGPDSLGIVYTLKNGSGSPSSNASLNGNPVQEIYPWLESFAIADMIAGENVLDFSTSVSQNSSGGISTLDVVEAQKLLLEITSDYPLRAVLADVDDSGFLGVNDLVLMRQYILGIITDFPAATNQYFSDSYTFPADFDVFDFTAENFREYRFEDTEVTQEDLYFNVFRMADINGVTTPDSLGTPTATVRSSKKLRLTDRAVSQGETVMVPLQLEAEEININALQMSLNFSNLSLKNVINNYTGSQLFYNEVSTNEVRFSFLDDDTHEYFDLTLELEVLADGMLSDMISLSSEYENLVVSYDNHATIDMDFGQSSSVDEVLEVEGNVLNGFMTISLQEDHTSEIKIFDMAGKMIFSQLPQNNTVTLDRSDFKSSGIYIVNTLSNGKQVSLKIVVI